MPKPVHPSIEAEMNIRTETYNKIYREYADQNCNRKGEQKRNTDDSITRGIRSLKEKMNSEQAMILCTDKSGKFSMVSKEVYLKMGRDHTKNDIKINWDRAAHTQHLMNAHTSAWLNISSIGSMHKHEDRIRSSCLSNAISTANMYLLVKDHKQPSPDGTPKSRPVVSDCSGMGVHLSNLLSSYLEPISESIRDGIDVVSTEDALNFVL